MTVVPPVRAPAVRLQPLLNREFNNGGSDAAQAALQLSRMMQRSMCARTHCKHTPTPTQTHTRIHGRARPHTSARALTHKHTTWHSRGRARCCGLRWRRLTPRLRRRKRAEGGRGGREEKDVNG